MTVAQRWKESQAWEWYNRSGWRQGCNFLPSTAANQLEMFSSELDSDTIHRELKWASDLNYNAVRVFLHNLLYKKDGKRDFFEKIEHFLSIADRYGIKTMLVLFDGCWDPLPEYPIPADKKHVYSRVHNSRWVQAPGRKILEMANSTEQEMLLKPYVTSVVSHFGNDSRILLIDLFNEPDSTNGDFYGTKGKRIPTTREAYGKELSPGEKYDAVSNLIPRIFHWARSVGPIEVPLTVAIYGNDYNHKMVLRNKLHDWYLSHSDVISFHNYQAFNKGMQKQVEFLLSSDQYGNRPIICSEYMSRTTGSTFSPILGYLYSKNIWAFNWGLVAGRMQTQYPWDSWNRIYKIEPDPWHHDVLFPNGTPYSREEELYFHTYRQQERGMDQETQYSKNNIFKAPSANITKQGERRNIITHQGVIFSPRIFTFTVESQLYAAKVEACIAFSVVGSLSLVALLLARFRAKSPTGKMLTKNKQTVLSDH